MAGRLKLTRTLRVAAATWPRRLAAVTLVVAVIVVHGCVAEQMAEEMADLRADAAMPPRIEVAYVREMELSVPAIAPAPPRAVAVALKKRAARRPKPPASAPEPVAESPPLQAPPAEPDQVAQVPPQPVPPPPASEPASAAEPALAVPLAINAAASAPAPAASAAPFAWPVSTRLSYVLTGNWRGELHGSAQVEWIRIGMHYQVHLDVRVGLPFAPLYTRRMTSDGHLTAEGLVPERYDEEHKMMGSDRRRATIVFEPDALVLPNGQRRERWPGVQDQASQFVQLTYLFTIDPKRLAPGNTIDVPLALPRSVDRWVYDVLGAETLYTPFGAVEAMHLQPRRISRPGSDLSAEIWFAPALAYLPARIRIRQDAESFIDLLIERKPQLAQ